MGTDAFEISGQKLYGATLSLLYLDERDTDRWRALRIENGLYLPCKFRNHRKRVSNRSDLGENLRKQNREHRHATRQTVRPVHGRVADDLEKELTKQ